MLSLRRSLRAASLSIESCMGVLPSTLSPSTTDAPLGVESTKSVKLLRAAGAVSIFAAAGAGAGSVRRSANAATPATPTSATPKAITSGLRDEGGRTTTGVGDVATGAA